MSRSRSGHQPFGDRPRAMSHIYMTLSNMMTLFSSVPGVARVLKVLSRDIYSR